MTDNAVDVPRHTDVLVVGGGPAGSLLACLLARRGLEVVLLEKQVKLARDFRGETIAAPSVVTLRSLGFEPALKRHGYLETMAVNMTMEGQKIFRVDYSRFGLDVLPIDIPQPGLIGIFNAAAEQHPNYTQLTGTAFIDLTRDGDTVTGAVIKLADGTETTISARLVVGADGRFSKVRAAADLAAKLVPMERDFEWFKLPRPADWGTEADLVINRGRHLVVLPTFPDWLRIGHNVPKGALGDLRAAGFESFKQGVIDIDPRLSELVHENLHSWRDTSFLDIFTAELDQWTRDGLLLIGDASHTCTPILGQGVNLGIQDAVTFAPVIAAALNRRAGAVASTDLAEAEASRRKHKSMVTKFQRMQERALSADSTIPVAARRLRFRLLNALPLKYVVFGKIINTPHAIDQLDLELAAAAAAPVPAIS
jgi:2-polyprenyl-6-methoxyphenol hydroxylase-like FAD-dependent oxidoreductase